MSAATVYRVEHRDTLEGPYNAWKADATVYNMAYAHCDEERHPGPFEDGLLDAFAIRSKHVFGFDSHRALLEWFDGWLDNMAAKGFVIGVYTVPRECILYGNKQLVFERKAAELVAHEPLALAPNRFHSYR